MKPMKPTKEEMIDEMVRETTDQFFDDDYQYQEHQKFVDEEIDRYFQEKEREMFLQYLEEIPASSIISFLP